MTSELPHPSPPTRGRVLTVQDILRREATVPAGAAAVPGRRRSRHAARALLGTWGATSLTAVAGSVVVTTGAAVGLAVLPGDLLQIPRPAAPGDDQQPTPRPEADTPRYLDPAPATPGSAPDPGTVADVDAISALALAAAGSAGPRTGDGDGDGVPSTTGTASAAPDLAAPDLAAPDLVAEPADPVVDGTVPGDVNAEDRVMVDPDGATLPGDGATGSGPDDDPDTDDTDDTDDTATDLDDTDTDADLDETDTDADLDDDDADADDADADADDPAGGRGGVGSGGDPPDALMDDGHGTDDGTSGVGPPTRDDPDGHDGTDDGTDDRSDDRSDDGPQPDPGGS